MKYAELARESLEMTLLCQEGTLAPAHRHEIVRRVRDEYGVEQREYRTTEVILNSEGRENPYYTRILKEVSEAIRHHPLQYFATDALVCLEYLLHSPRRTLQLFGKSSPYQSIYVGRPDEIPVEEHAVEDWKPDTSEL